jgi:hypothetical protein
LKAALTHKPVTSPCFFPLSAALGQIMLYVDGMNGVINHSETIQWLYTLVGSKVRPRFCFLFMFMFLFFFSFGTVLLSFQVIGSFLESFLKWFCKEQSYSALLKSCLGIKDDSPFVDFFFKLSLITDSL